MINRLLYLLGIKKKKHAKTHRRGIPPTIMPRQAHAISRKNISKEALEVLQGLQNKNHQAFLVGGCVRDLLLGLHPKDFDVATDATPDEVYQTFRNCRLIGRRFRLAHVFYGRKIIEVATFRGRHPDKENEHPTILGHDNHFGSLEEDAFRRDFTVNALYYNHADGSIWDYTGGLEDLKKGRLRLIGDPHERYHEDPVRMLRAIRFAAKLGFDIEAHAAQKISENAALLEHVPSSRLYEEFLKLFMKGDALKTYELLRHYHLFKPLFPLTDAALVDNEARAHPFLSQLLINTDARVSQDMTVNPAFLYAGFLWPAILQKQAHIDPSAPPGRKRHLKRMVFDEVFLNQIQHVSLLRRLHRVVREIFDFQIHLEDRLPKRVPELVSHPRFRAGYDFLLLRASCDATLQALAEWWTHFIKADHAKRESMMEDLLKVKKRTRPKRNKKPEKS